MERVFFFGVDCSSVYAFWRFIFGLNLSVFLYLKSKRNWEFLLFQQEKMVTKLILPVEPLFALGIIGVLGIGARFALKEWQKFENDGKVSCMINMSSA